MSPCVIVLATAAVALSAADGDRASEAVRTSLAIRRAVASGVAAGRKELVFVGSASGVERARVVSATEEALVVAAGGAELPIPWERLEPARLYQIGRKYLAADDAASHVQLARFCLAHGLATEAEEELREALRLSPQSRDELRELEARLAEIRPRTGQAAVAPANGEPAEARAANGKPDRATYLRDALNADFATIDKRLGPRAGENEPEPEEIFLRHADGTYNRGWEKGKEPVDWTGLAGQVLYVPLEQKNPGVDRMRFCWSFHENHGGARFWHVYELAPTMKDWFCKSPDPAARHPDWTRAAGGALAYPVAVARAPVAWSNCGVIAFRNGLVGATGYGNNDDRYPFIMLPPNKVPAAVAVTPNNEFALVAVRDIAELRGQLAVIALEARALAQHSFPYAGLPNAGTYTRLKLLGFVDLPGMAAPSAVSATGDVSRWAWLSPIAKERLDSQESRDRWQKGADANHKASSFGYAVVASRSEDRVAFVDLSPLYQYMRTMYFTTQENFEKTKNEGASPDQWPFTFDVARLATPRLAGVVPVPRPTAVAAGIEVPRDRTFLSKAFVACEDGRLIVFDVSHLVGRNPGVQGAPVPTGMIQLGRNPVSIAYGRYAERADHLIVACRGDREVLWVDTSAGGKVVRRLRDGRLADPVAVALWDSRGAFGVSVADFAGRKIVNYLCKPIDSWGDRLFGGLGPDGRSEFECTGVLELPGHPYSISCAEIN